MIDIAEGIAQEDINRIVNNTTSTMFAPMTHAEKAAALEEAAAFAQRDGRGHDAFVLEQAAVDETLAIE
jgi:hypothetical protein